MSISADSAPRGDASAITGKSPIAQLGRYTILFRFAAGGMAEVFVGRLRGAGGFEKPVAIKRMLPSLAEETRFVDMFLDEARIAAMITSPNVVPTLDVDTDDEGAPYIVMELVVGASLSQLQRGMNRQQMEVPIPVAVEVLAQAAQGLHDAHEARRPSGERLELVHRDVSPQNILVGVDGRARIMDFGIARALERVTQTSTGEVKGKLAYFSPEQASAAVLDGRSDVFALGIVAWELLVGKRLFQRDSPSQTLFAVLESEIPAPHTMRAAIPESVSRAVMRALEREVDKRWPSAAAFAQALRAAGVPMVSPPEVGAWVSTAGGETLLQFRSRIASSFSGEPTKVLDAPVKAALVEANAAQSREEIEVHLTHATSATVELFAGSPRGEIRSSRGVDSVAQPAPAPAKKPFWRVAVAVLVVLGLGGLAWSQRGSSEAPEATSELAAVDVQPTPRVEVPEPAEPEAAEPVPAVLPEVPVSAGAAPTLPEAVTPPSQTERRLRPARPTAAASTETLAPEVPPAPQVAPEPPPAPTTTTPTPRGRLMGLDHFRPAAPETPPAQ